MKKQPVEEVLAVILLALELAKLVGEWLHAQRSSR